MNRGQFVTALTARLGINSTGDGLLNTAALQDCLALALNDLSDVQPWPWLLTTGSLTFTDGIAAFPTSPPVVHLHQLTINGRRARKASSLPEFLDCLSDGRRHVWFYQGTNVKLAPVPSTAPTSAVLYYLQPEPALANDAASPLAPTQYHNVILARAAYHAEIRRTRWEAAAQHLGEYEAGLARMKGSERMTTGPRQIRAVGDTNWASW
jgi:hypothetical protein